MIVLAFFIISIVYAFKAMREEGKSLKSRRQEVDSGVYDVRECADIMTNTYYAAGFWRVAYAWLFVSVVILSLHHIT